MEIDEKCERLAIDLNNIPIELARQLVNKFFKPIITEVGDLNLDYGTNETEFEKYVGRLPNEVELKEFARLLTSGAEAQLDWEIICTTAANYFKDKITEQKAEL